MWCDVIGYEGLYQINKYNKIKSKYTNKLIKTHKDNNGYRFVVLTKNKKIKNISIHTIVIQQKIKRLKTNKECTHHINENKADNNINNLILFASQSEHTRFHKKQLKISDLIKLSNDSYVVNPKLYENQYKCKDCGEPVTRQYNTCSKCAFAKMRKVKRPSKDELYNLLCKYPFTKVGKQYGVSDNAIRKWCKLYGLSAKSKDYKTGCGV